MHVVQEITTALVRCQLKLTLIYGRQYKRTRARKFQRSSILSTRGKDNDKCKIHNSLSVGGSWRALGDITVQFIVLESTSS